MSSNIDENAALVSETSPSAISDIQHDMSNAPYSLDASYPAINRALGILRARLSLYGSPAADMSQAHAQIGAAESHNSSNSANNGVVETPGGIERPSALKQLALHSAEVAFRKQQIKPSCRPKTSSQDDQLLSTLLKLNDLYKNYLVGKCFVHFKHHVQKMHNLKRNLKCTLQTLVDSIAAVPLHSRKTQLLCMQRLGKLRLAELHHKRKLQRNVIKDWLKYIFVTDK